LLRAVTGGNVVSSPAYEPPISVEQVADLCRRNDISYLGVFGSFARGDFTPESDVDLLARFSKPKGLLDLVRIEEEFAERLGRKVDLAVEGGLSPYIVDRVMADLKDIYAEP
jgi:predicted nucleotidyltransferase